MRRVSASRVFPKQHIQPIVQNKGTEWPWLWKDLDGPNYNATSCFLKNITLGNKHLIVRHIEQRQTTLFGRVSLHCQLFEYEKHDIMELLRSPSPNDHWGRESYRRHFRWKVRHLPQRSKVNRGRPGSMRSQWRDDWRRNHLIFLPIPVSQS